MKNVELFLSNDLSKEETDIWKIYDDVDGVKIFLSPEDKSQGKTLNIQVRVECLENLAENTLKIQDIESPILLESEINFLDYLKGIHHEVLGFVPNLTLTTEIYQEIKLVSKLDTLIKNPWYDHQQINTEFTEHYNLENSRYPSRIRHIKELFLEAAKEVYKNGQVKLRFESYGPQLFLEFSEGGNLPFMKFYEDFIWIQKSTEYPELEKERIEEKREEYAGFFIYTEDYSFLSRLTTVAACSQDFLIETLQKIEVLQQ